MPLVKSSTVEEEMKKNSELEQSHLDILRDWLKKQAHLPPVSDSELILFLHSNYYRIEPTKSTIDAYFTTKTHVPEIFSGRDPLRSQELQDIMKVVCCLLLPGTTPEGYKVMFVKLLDSNPSHYSSLQVVRLIMMAVDLWVYIAGTNPAGHIILIDLDGFVFGHFARFRPAITKKYLYYLQEALPIRLKGIHFMNTVPFMDAIMNFAKPFMKNEMMDSISLHSRKESLAEKIPIDLLPDDQGGKAGSLKDLWAAAVKDIEEHSAWFQEEETRQVNEAARPEKAKNATDLFGVEGSFKQLDID